MYAIHVLEVYVCILYAILKLKTESTNELIKKNLHKIQEI